MKKDIILNFIFTFFTSLLLFFQNRYFVQYLGIETLGIMKLFSQLLQYLNIVELGLGSASAFALYKPLAERDIEKISIILSTIKRSYNKISIVIFSLGLVVTPFLPYFMKIDSFHKNIYLYWLLYLVNTVSTYLYIKYVILFTASQEFIYVRFIQSTSKAFYQILQIIFIIKYQSFFIFVLVILLDNLTQYILFRIHYERKYFYIYETKERYTGLIKDIKNLFWHKIGGLVVFNTDLILISKFVSLEIVGIYASYQLILQMVLMLSNISVSVMRPKLGKYISINNKNSIYVLYKKINIIFLYIGLLLTMCTYILIDNFIKIWIGVEYILSNLTIQLLMINLLINIFRTIVEVFKETSGFFDDIQAPILEAIINLVFSIILGIKYGLDGIIIGTIISNILVIMIYKPILVFKRCFDKGVKEYIKIYGNYLILLIISLILLNIATKPFIRTDINTWIDWIIYAITISVITGVALFIAFMSNKDFRNVIKVYVLKKNDNI